MKITWIQQVKEAFECTKALDDTSDLKFWKKF